MTTVVERPSVDEIEELQESYGEPEVLENDVKLVHLEYEGDYPDCKGEGAIAIHLKDGKDKVVGIRHQGVKKFCLPIGRIWESEAIVEGVMREALEETGLEIELEDLKELRKVTFKFSNAELERWIFLFKARKIGGKLEPKDQDEIAEAEVLDGAWGTWTWEKGNYVLRGWTEEG